MREKDKLKKTLVQDGEAKDELDQVTIDLARVTRVMAGGKGLWF